MIRENAPKFAKERPREVSPAEMRREDIAEAIRRRNLGEEEREFREDYENL